MRALSRLPFLAVNAAGVVAFSLPFLLGAGPGSTEQAARGADAPWLLALLLPLLLAVAIAEAAGGRMDARVVALLGALAGLAALLRLPVSLAGANLLFLLPILAGFTFGASFGFLLGSLAIATSAAISGGVGPWLPFQMWAAGWVGAGAGVLRPFGDRLARRRLATAAVLGAYGYAAAFLYGGVINLYFWPVTPSLSEIGWAPGLGLAETLRHYRDFYLVTSLAWDAVGGVANAVLLLLLGAPLAELLRRYRRRFEVTVEDSQAPRPESAVCPAE